MSVGLSGIDIAVLVLYLAGILTMSWAFARRQRTGEDYFLAGRKMRGSPLALSILANQASAISLVGAPAFVALREGGGLRWLQYELALPLAMAVLLAVLLPALRSVPGSSIYVYAERRFGRASRRALAAAFLLSRGLALGVIVYASALVVSEALGWPLDTSIVAIGAFSLIYTGMAGIVADIWSDVVQLGLLFFGTLFSGVYLLAHYGATLLESVPEARARTILADQWGLTDGGTFAFWPMLLGGLFLYVSYYGTDQSQAQRLLTARDGRAAGRALVMNGLLRFPLVLTYCLFGLLLAGLLRIEPGFASLMSGRPDDSLVPVFMMTYLPAGLRGLLLAGILAAAMSSIDSAMNSLAAVTLEDVFDRAPDRQGVWLSRATSVAWGSFAVVSGMFFARSGQGVLELVNQVGSAFYGPVLAVFVAGALAKGVTQRGVLAGLAAGLAGNFALASFVPGVSWLWWNPAGFAVTLAVAVAASNRRPDFTSPRWPPGATALLIGAFVLMLATLALLPSLLDVR